MDDQLDCLKKGFYLEQEKNRFVCNVLINEQQEKCYLPFPNRLSSYFYIDNNEVLLLPVKNSNAKYKLSLFAIKIQRSYVLVNLAYANNLLFTNLRKRSFCFLGARKEFSKEFNVSPSYKTDIYIQKTKTIIEVKTIIGFSEQIFFPQEKSSRLINQLKSILALLKQGYKAYLFICVLTNHIKKIKLNPCLGEITEHFNNCINAGMKVHCRRLCFSEKKQDFVFKDLVIFEN